MTRVANNHEKGFALIEVLIAVVVLAFGLLALAALQSALIKASSESKAQSVALSLAKDRLDVIRAFNGIDGVGGYQGIQDAALVQVDGDPATAGVQAIGGVQYSLKVTVERFVQAGGAFSLVASDAGAVGADRNEFKRISVEVSWPDANGNTQSVVVEDAVSALDPGDSAKLGRSLSGTGPRPAKTLIVNPDSVDGVIPIALGGSDATAATNPKPIIEGGKKGSEKFIETRYDVLTYSAINDKYSLAQARVETVIVGCTCSRTSGSVAGYRPTYWDGTRYVPPEQKQYTTYGVSNDNTQSPYCTICCRDHQDESIASSKAKVSPYRSTHSHEALSGSTWSAVAVGGVYNEACRLIRVDGILDVAADPYNEAYTSVPTGLSSASLARTPTPSPTGEASYKSFVLSYLDSRYVQNPPGSDTAAKVKFNTRWTPSPLPVAATAGLNTPESIAVKSPDMRWMHSRGLYVDYLEPSARSAVDRAIKNCKGTGTAAPTGAQKRDCVLRVLPFTSINLTEVAEWSERLTDADTKSGVSRIVVQNTAFAGAIDGDKGVVQPRSNASNGSAWGWTIAGGSASGLTGKYPWVINNDEQQEFAANSTPEPSVLGTYLADGLEFVLSDGGSGSTEQFYVDFATGYTHNKEFVDSTLPATCSFRNAKWECAPTGSSTLGGAVAISISGYNYPASVTKTNPCQTNKTASMDYWVLRPVTGAASSGGGSVSPIVTSGADLKESVSFSVSPLNSNDTVTVSFGSPTYKCPSYTCAGPGNNTVVYNYSSMATCTNPAP